MGELVRAISENGGIIICALDSTDIVHEMEQIHRPSAVVTAALGRLLTGAALMGSFLKNTEDSITLRIKGNGPIGSMIAITDGNANVRGYAQNNIVEVPLREDGKLNVGAAVGKNGMLAVVRDLGLKEPYVGQIPLVTGEIAEDITSYYATSEQIPTVCSLGVLVNKDLSVRRAGGFLLQLLPGASNAEIDKIEENIAKIPPVTKLLENGGTVHDMVRIALDSFSPNLLDTSTASYKCHCSEEKTESILISLGIKELEKLQEEQANAEVECHFCGKKYDISIENILNELKGHK